MLKPKNIYKKQWGKLTVVESKGIPLMLPSLKGGTYDSGEYEDFRVTLSCECGTEIYILDSEFPGFEKMATCGNPQCVVPIAVKSPPGRPKRQGVSVTLQLTWPQATKLMEITGEREELEKACGKALQEYLESKMLLPIPEWWDGTVE